MQWSGSNSKARTNEPRPARLPKSFSICQREMTSRIGPSRTRGPGKRVDRTLLTPSLRRQRRQIVVAQEGVEVVVDSPAAQLEIGAQPAFAFETRLLQHALGADVIHGATSLDPLQQGVVVEVLDQEREGLAHHSPVLVEGGKGIAHLGQPVL